MKYHSYLHSHQQPHFSTFRKHVIKNNGFYLACILSIITVLCSLILLCGDVHSNPGPCSTDTRKHKQFSLCHVNIRSLNLRLSSVETKLAPLYDVITLSETLLTQFIDSNDIKLQDFQEIYRLDRLDRGGGGVAAYIKNDIYVKRRDDLQLDNIELLWLELKVDKSHCLLGVVYRPPDSPVSFWDDFQSAIDMVKQCGIVNIIITGDLNADPNTANGKKLERLVDINNLYIHIPEPARYTPTSETCLDQLITSKLDIVKTVHVEPPVSTNDHCTIGAMFNFKISNGKAYHRHVWQYNQGDYEGFNEEIRQTDWNYCFETEDINIMCQRWTDKFLNLARQFIPNYVATIRPKDKPYYSSTLRKQKHEVNRAFHKARRTKTLDDWNTYKTLNTNYTKDVESAKKEYEISLASSLQNPAQLGPRKWWSTVKCILGYNPESDIPSIKTANNCIISDNADKAGEFNRFFLSYSNIDDSQSSLPDNIDTCQSSLEHIQTNSMEVCDILKSLDTSKAVGPDGINPRLLKETASSIAPSLTRLFNYSLNCGEFPAG